MSDNGFRLSEEDLLPLSIGAAFLGTGGGGNPYLGMLRLREVLRGGGVAQILPLSALPDEAWVTSVGGIGAPVIGIEKLSEGRECLRALRAVEEAAGQQMSALIPIEIGGANAMAPIITAAQAGLPVLDGDGMGRAFPEGQMTTFAIYGGRREGPSALSDDKGNVVVLRSIQDAVWRERLARSLTVTMGAGAGAAGAPMQMAFVRRAAIPGTITQALEIGRVCVEARARRQNVVERLVEATGATLVFCGKITDLKRELTGGFSRGHAVLAGLDDFAGSEAKIAIQNENLVAWVDGRPVVTVPDLIINIELDTGTPLTTEVLRYGQRVAVLGLPAPALLTTPAALKVVGPAGFGYDDLDWTPLPWGQRSKEQA